MVRVMWDRGALTLTYLDDRYSAADTRARANHHSLAEARLETALGWTFGLSKCHFIAVQQLQFLGLVIDSLKASFIVPDTKLQAVLHRIRQALRDPAITMRQLASIAGQVCRIDILLRWHALWHWSSSVILS